MNRNQCYPSWDDVGVPPYLVEHIRRVPAGRVLNALSASIVRHVGTRMSLSYHCEVCGHAYKPQRAAEEYSLCSQCQSMRIRCIRVLKTATDKAQPQPQQRRNRPQGIQPYGMPRNHDPEDQDLEDEDVGLESILKSMNDNYSKYFGVEEPGEFVKSTWNSGSWRVKFCGGEQVFERSVAVAHKRAAILCPFLWDRTWDWKKGFRIQEYGRKVHLTPILWQMGAHNHG